MKRIKGKKKSVGSAPGASSSHAAPRTPSMELSARDKAKARVAQIEIYATTAVSFLLLVMACAHWFTDVRQRVATFQWLQGVWDVYEQYASVPRRPSHTSWDSWCDLVHSFTSSCFFLSGATNKSVVADGWEHVRSPPRVLMVGCCFFEISSTIDRHPHVLVTIANKQRAERLSTPPLPLYSASFSGPWEAMSR